MIDLLAPIVDVPLDVARLLIDNERPILPVIA
jgi:hypothetical protein